jgi:SAM-dependent methyltransferase
MLREFLSYEVRYPKEFPIQKDSNGFLIQAGPFSTLHWSRQVEWPWAVLNADLKKSHVALDIGSGQSVFKFLVADKCKRLTTLDHDSKTVIETGFSARQLGFKNIIPVDGDARKLPFKDNTFDRVFLISVMEHMPSGHIKAVKELKRVLKPGGIGSISFDIAVSGHSDIDFHVNIKQAWNIMKELGVERDDNLLTNSATVTLRDLGGLSITAVLVSYKKD